MAKDPALKPDYIVNSAGEFGANYGYVDFAWAIGYYHEEYGNKGGQPQIEYAMDMHNNNVGLGIGRKLGEKATFDDVCAACDKALRDGELIWIEREKLTKPASYYIPGKNEHRVSSVNVYNRTWYKPITTDREGKPGKVGDPFCPHDVFPFK